MATRAEVDAAIADSVDVDKADLREILKEGINDDYTDAASASTVDLGAVASTNIRITGTTTITAFGTVAAGTFRRLRFAGALTLTHHATSLIIPGGASIVTVAGDRCDAISLGSGNWLVHAYTGATTTQAQTIIGGAAMGRSLFTTATAADARSAMGVPAIPTASAGVGQFGHVTASSGGDLVLPAGGNWAWWALRLDNSTGGIIIADVEGSAGTAGGTTIQAGVSSYTWTALVWRVV